MACAIVAKKMNIKVTHVEAGIRSEIWLCLKKLTESLPIVLLIIFYNIKICIWKFIENGIDSSNVHFVGNVMIDTLHQNLNRISPPSFWNEFGLETGNYIILTYIDHRTLMRKSNRWLIYWKALTECCDKKIIFQFILELKILGKRFEFENILFVEPQGYLNFMYL
jgi:UDP-N-acetylglucosamine 2-epimerase (non-hydrolysing)